MQRYSFTVRYKGNKHCGWAAGRNSRAIGVVTTLEDCLKRSTNGIPPVVTGAGRTDARVNATGQQAHVDLLRQTKNKYYRPRRVHNRIPKHNKGLIMRENGIRGSVKHDSVSSQSPAQISDKAPHTDNPSTPISSDDLILDKNILLLANDQSIHARLDQFIQAQAKTKSPNRIAQLSSQSCSLLPLHHSFTHQTNSQMTTSPVNTELIKMDPKCSESNSNHSTNIPADSFLLELRELTAQLDQFMRDNKEITYSKAIQSHNPAMSLFMSSAFALSCVRDEFKHCYDPHNLSLQLISHPSLPNPVKPSTSAISSLNKPSKPAPNHPPKAPATQSQWTDSTIVSKLGANLLQLQPPMTPRELNILWNSTLHGDLGVEGTREARVQQKQLQFGTTPKPPSHLSHLITINSESEGDFDSRYMGGIENDGRMKMKYKVRPPTVFGSVAVSNVKATIPMYLPHVVSDQAARGDTEGEQDEEQVEIAHLTCPSSTPLSAPQTSNQSTSSLKTHPKQYLNPHYLPTHHRPRHSRFDAWKRQYKYRVHFDSLPYDPFDHVFAPQMENSSKLCPPLPSEFPTLSSMTETEQHLYSLYRSAATEHHHNPGTIMSFKVNKQSFDYWEAFRVAKTLTGKHNYNAFRNAQCQAFSPIRRVDDITFSFEPTMSQLISNGVSHQSRNHLSFQRSVNFLSTSSIDSARVNGFIPTFANACRAAIADVISLLIRRSVSPPHRASVSDPLLTAGAHYEELLTDLREVRQFLTSSSSSHSPPPFLSPSDIEFLLDILHTTQYLHSVVLAEWKKGDESERKIVQDFITQNVLDQFRASERDVLTIQYTARAYLHNQVRIMTGAILKAGVGELKAEQVQDYLNASLGSASTTRSTTCKGNQIRRQNVDGLDGDGDFDEDGVDSSLLQPTKHEQKKKDRVKSHGTQPSQTQSKPSSSASQFLLTAGSSGELRGNNESKTAPASGLFFTQVFYPTDHSDFFHDHVDTQRILSQPTGTQSANIGSDDALKKQKTEMHSPLSAAKFLHTDPMLFSQQYHNGDYDDNGVAPKPAVSKVGSTSDGIDDRLREFHQNQYETVSSVFGPEHNLAIWRKIVAIQSRFTATGVYSD